MAKERILITVKTYPTLSRKYDELVCTAGLREDGSWVRIYPVEFRKRKYSEQYRKYEWIELDLVKNSKDKRVESYRPKTHDSPIIKVDEIKPDGDAWLDRRKIVLQNVYTDFDKLKAEAKNKNIGTSLATFKPAKFLDFIIEEEKEREWSKDKLDRLNQMNLFENDDKGKFEVVKKLPYKFSYRIADQNGVQSKMMIEDWEIGQLFWNQLKRKGTEEAALEDVRKKYWDDFVLTKDLHLFLGTTLANHFRAPNPFIIIGTFHPKPITQTRMFL
jgi:hypothetical protein